MSNKRIVQHIAERPSRHVPGWARFVVLGLVFHVGCGDPQKPPAPITLTLGAAVPQTDLQKTSLTALLNSFLFSETLVGVGADGRAVPRLADSWTWSDDGLSLDLKLKPNPKFHDGSTLSLELARDTLRTLIKESTSQTSVSAASVQSIEAIEPDTLRIRLSRREAFLLADLVNLAFTKPGNPDIGVGPFKLLTRTPAPKLSAFDDYYRGRPKVDFVDIKEYPDQRTTWAALMRGEIDAVHDMTPQSLDFVEQQKTLRAFTFTRPYFFALFFNIRHPQLSKPQIRQGLSQAIDRQQMVDNALNSRGDVADGPIWPQHWAHTPGETRYSQNVEASILRLENAGLKSVLHKGSGMPSRLSFTCLVPSGNATYERLALVLQKQLYAISVDMKVETLSPRQVFERMNTGNYDAILTERISGRSLAWTYLTFHSKVSSFGYTASDKLLDQLRVTRDETEIKSIVSSLQRVFYDDPPALFLAWPKAARAVSTRFQVPGEGDRDVLGSLWQWQPVTNPR